ncbi:MAG: hypothetical protein CVU06_10385 [Bacteroidetes bacterium HGW-Bacteroidetes-22]|nr:MAG: hypothetical protein CVU06_10385 [Bacteroidetes bacterium HGW-Bacteroidetes-22]
MKTNKIRTSLLVLLIPVITSGQQAGDSVLSLRKCIQMCMTNNLSLKQAYLETIKSRHQIQEAKSEGLPQISGLASFSDYFDIPVNMVSGDIVGQPGTMVPIRLGTKYNVIAGIQAGQMIYNASYFASVNLFRKGCEISDLSLEQQKEEMVFRIAQLYILVQTMNRQIILLDTNLSSFRKLYAYSQQHLRNGLICKAESDRITVVINNTEAERDDLVLKRNQQLNMLKYLAGIGQTRKIKLSDDMVDVGFSRIQIDTTFENLTEMKIMKQKEKFAEINLRYMKAGSSPSLSGFAEYSFQAQVEQMDEINKGSNWYTTSYIGIRLSVPVFEGNRIKGKINQSRVALEQSRLAQRDLQGSLVIQFENAMETLLNNQLTEFRLKTNLELAGNVVSITEDQYHQGIKTFTDVLNARSEYNTSYLSWLNSKLQIDLSQLEIIKLNGTINSLLL